MNTFGTPKKKIQPNPALNRPACGGQEAARFELIWIMAYNRSKSNPAGLLTPLLGVCFAFLGFEIN